MAGSSTPPCGVLSVCQVPGEIRRSDDDRTELRTVKGIGFDPRMSGGCPKDVMKSLELRGHGEHPPLSMTDRLVSSVLGYSGGLLALD